MDFFCSFIPILQYVQDKFEAYLRDESGLNRRHIVDNRVHCCLYFIGFSPPPPEVEYASKTISCKPLSPHKMYNEQF